jgi:hypothetical protein
MILLLIATIYTEPVVASTRKNDYIKHYLTGAGEKPKKKANSTGPQQHL